MIYIIVGMWLISALLVLAYMQHTDKEVFALEKKLKSLDNAYRTQFEMGQNTYDGTVLLRQELASLAKKFQELDADQLGRFETFQKKLQKELEFMRAHQHGMDKRIAGLKKEVIVTINEPGKIEGPETKKLLKRAGVTK